MKTYKIAETFLHEGTKLITKEPDKFEGCVDCYFFNHTGTCRELACLGREREDKKEIIFKQLTK